MATARKKKAPGTPKRLGLRAYARFTGRAVSTIQEALASDRIEREPDGLFDVEKCERLWRERTDPSKVRTPPAPTRTRPSESLLDEIHAEALQNAYEVATSGKVLTEHGLMLVDLGLKPGAAYTFLANLIDQHRLFFRNLPGGMPLLPAAGLGVNWDRIGRHVGRKLTVEALAAESSAWCEKDSKPWPK